MPAHIARRKGRSEKYRSTRRGMVVILVASRVCRLPLADTCSTCCGCLEARGHSICQGDGIWAGDTSHRCLLVSGRLKVALSCLGWAESKHSALGTYNIESNLCIILQELNAGEADIPMSLSRCSDAACNEWSCRKQESAVTPHMRVASLRGESRPHTHAALPDSW